MNEVLSVEEVAGLLCCETKTVEERLRRGELPGVKLGRSWICPKSALLEAVNDLARSNLAVRLQPVAIAYPQEKRRGRKRSEPPSLNPVPIP